MGKRAINSNTWRESVSGWSGVRGLGGARRRGGESGTVGETMAGGRWGILGVDNIGRRMSRWEGDKRRMGK